MEDDTRELLEKNLEVSQQSLELLKKLHQDLVWRRTFALLRTLILVALLIFGFIQIRPYLDSLLKASQNILQTVEQIQDIKRFLPAQ